MKNNIVEELRKRIKPANRIFTKKNLAVSDQISYILEQRGWSQKDLAIKMGKEPSEISKLMSGLHNLTLMSLANIENALGEEILITPLEAQVKYKKIEYIFLKEYANTNCINVFRKPFQPVEYKKTETKIVS